MAISYFGEKKPYILNHVRTRKIKEGFLVTTDHGTWAHLDKIEYQQLKNHELKGPMISFLKDIGVILDENNVQSLIKDYRKKCEYLFQGTSLHIVVPTLRCNIKCLYCHAMARPMNEKGYDMDEETAKKTVDLIFQSPSKTITIEFQGGEALLRFDIIKYIVQYAKKLNKKHKKELTFRLVTNLTLMTDEILDFVVDETIGICTSLDGCKEVHNKNRQEYEKTLEWIKKIKEKREVNALMLTTKHSLPYHKEIVDEYVNLGFKTIWVKPVANLGFAKENWKEIGITEKEFLDFWKKALDYIVKVNKKTFLVDYYVTTLLKKILTKDCINYTDLESPCGAAIVQLLYNHDGGIYTCDEGKLFEVFKLGNVNNSYKEILTSKGTASIVKASMNDNSICEVCAYKPYCGLCPVCSYAETGNILTKLPDRRCRIIKGMFDHIFKKLIFDEEYKKTFLDWVKKKEI